jgi:hypothetical protein
MSQPKPPFHELEFAGSTPLFPQGDASPRRVFLMPLSNPAEFLAFGVRGPSEEVVFVARGTVREHLGGFISRMAQEGAQVELYARPPLPGHILHEYTSGGPFETQASESPPPPPDPGTKSPTTTTTKKSTTTSTA